MAPGLQGLHVILVHGAWQGAWVWDRFAPLLCAAGCTVEAIDLPGSRGDGGLAGFEDQVQSICTSIDATDRPVILIGHSGGAVLACQAAEQRHLRIAALVLLAGILLPSGGSLSQMIADMVALGEPPESLQGIRPYLQWSDDRMVSSVPAAAASEVFLHDCTPEVQTFAASRLVAQSERARAGVPRLNAERYGQVPRIYVEALQDRSLVLKLQRKMQAMSPCSRVVSLDSGHVPQLSQPVALMRALQEPLTSVVHGRSEHGSR